MDGAQDEIMETEEDRSFGNVSSLTLGIATVYFLYYVFYIVQKPSVSCNPKLRRFLSEHCPLLQENFWPTIWCIEARVQTIVRSLLQSRPHVPYVRELLLLRDNGQIALDWIENNASPLAAETRPTIIILPGLTGSSCDSYVLHFVLESMKLGFRSVVFNYRGNGGSELKTSQTYSATYTADLESVIECVQKKHPSSPIIATGVSLGGVILANYLAKTGKDSKIIAGMVVSPPWNVFESAKSLEQPINLFVFNKYLTDNLKQSVLNHEHLFRDKCDLQHVYKSRTIRDFDERFTAKLFGYKTTEDYYHDACIDRKVHDIKVPLLCLNAADDPFSPGQSIPVKEASRSSHVAIVVTSRGGHIAFFDGCFLPNEISYMQRIFSQFTTAIVSHGDELLVMDAADMELGQQKVQ